MKVKELENYITNIFKQKFSVCEIKGDASNRKYYRAKSEASKYIIMDSSLEKRNFNNFQKFTKIYNSNGVLVPKVFYEDYEKKFLIIEDLGNNLIFNKVNKNNLKKIYKNSISNIIKIQNINKKSIKKYRSEDYFKESFLYIKWVLEIFFKIEIPKKDYSRLIKSLNSMIKNMNHNCNKLVHRDYHSKNIFYKNNKIIIIDYQDSLYGSPLYDFVSLVNDCYRDINTPDKNIFIKFFLSCYNENNKSKFSIDEFLHNFYLVTAQRHLKAAGIFCRLSAKYNRHNYIPHLKRTLNYIETATSKYDNLNIINIYANEALNLLDESNYSRCRQR